MGDKVEQTHQGKKAKVLSLGEQKKALRGVKKVTGSKVIKSSLESPFALEWPNVSIQEEEEVCQLFTQACNGLQVKSQPAIPWYKIRRLPLHERNALKKENISQGRMEAQFQETWRDHLIMGYNCVMKAVERNDVVGVLVKKNTEPSFLAKAFLPGCATKGIPLVPVAELDKLVQSQKGLGLKHSCLVIGLRNCVLNLENRFHPLYLKLCEVLGVQQDEEQEGSDDDDDEEMSQIVEKEANKCEAVKTRQLSEAEIMKYFLKRTKHSGRVFIPPGDATESRENRTTPGPTGFGADFISLGSSLTDREEHKPSSVEIKKTAKENNAQKSYATQKSSAFPKDFIFLDAAGDHTDIPEAITETMEASGVVSATPEGFSIPKDTSTSETCFPSETDRSEKGQSLKSAGDCSIPTKKKRKQQNPEPDPKFKKKHKRLKPGPEYKPAIIKKTKNDPNRKGRIGKI